MCHPLLLIDIDGVISLFGFDPQRRPAGRFVAVDGVPHFLSEAVAARLVELGGTFDLVWCSGWEEKAEEYLPHTLGLPAGLPFLSFAGVPAGDGQHWKLASIDRYAGPDRPLAWIDDAHDERCRAWATARSGPTLLVTTDPAAGLTEVQAAQLRTWAAAL
jgi:hypothetical protein